MEPTSRVLPVAGREPPLPRQARRITMPQLGETKAATWEQKENGRLPSNRQMASELDFVLFFLMISHFRACDQSLFDTETV